MLYQGQWVREAREKLSAKGPKIMTYHGADRTRDLSHLLEHDIVVTSYETLTADQSRKDSPGRPGSRSPCTLLYWHRVVLDESQNIVSNRMCFVPCRRVPTRALCCLPARRGTSSRASATS